MFFFEITTIDDSIDNDPNYVEPALNIEGEEEEEEEEEDDDDDDHDDGDKVDQYDEFG